MMAVGCHAPEPLERPSRARPRPVPTTGTPAAPVAPSGTQKELDAALAQSFPASDPPSWTSTIACVQPAGSR
jgi:hypothetical protein